MLLTPPSGRGLASHRAGRRATGFASVRRVVAGMLLFAVATVTMAAAPGQGNAKIGQILFLQCSACHSAGAKRGGKLGPPLQGVVGRRAGTEAGYPYSKALRSSHLVWTPKELDRWITDPQALVPGTAMMFPGISSATQRADLIAYLETLKSPAEPRPRPRNIPSRSHGPTVAQHP